MDFLSALEASDPGPNVHSKISNPAHLPRLCEEQVQNCRSERRHFEFVFPLSTVILWYRQVELLPRIILNSLIQYPG